MLYALIPHKFAKNTMEKITLLVLLNQFTIITANSNSCIIAQPFIRGSEINHHHFEGFNSSDVSHHVTPYLHKCKFERMDNLATSFLCEKGCSVHETCSAYFYDNVCELCVTEIQGADTLEHALAELFIGLRRFEEYVTGSV